MSPEILSGFLWKSYQYFFGNPLRLSPEIFLEFFQKFFQDFSGNPLRFFFFRKSIHVFFSEVLLGFLWKSSQYSSRNLLRISLKILSRFLHEYSLEFSENLLKISLEILSGRTSPDLYSKSYKGFYVYLFTRTILISIS